MKCTFFIFISWSFCGFHPKEAPGGLVLLEAEWYSKAALGSVSRNLGLWEQMGPQWNEKG